MRSSGPIFSPRLLLKWHDFPTLLVQRHDYCAHPSWFKRKLLQLKKLAVMCLPLLRVFASKYIAPVLLEIIGIKAVRQTYPKVFGVTIS